MPYPPPPWKLKGYACLAALHLIDVAHVRSLVPKELSIVPILPGKTLGGIYVATYGEGSTLTYNELIVVSAIAYGAGRVGSWISHIYVDHPDSVMGGREIWGLPKEMARFEWGMTGQPWVQVSQGDRLLCKLTTHWRSPQLPLPVSLFNFSAANARSLMFKAQGNLNLQLARVNLHVPTESPFSQLEFGQSWLSFYSNSLSLVIDAPVGVES